MESKNKYTIWDRKINWAEAFVKISDLVKRRGFDPAGDQHRTTIWASPIKTLTLDSIEESIQVFRKLKSFDLFTSSTYYLSSQRKEKSQASEKLYIYLEVGGKIEVGIRSTDFDLVEGLHNEIKEELHLRNPELSLSNNPLYLQPTVFVARHFDESGNNAFIILEDFLKLLAFDVKQGAEYESRDIPEKVRERIDNQDIFIALVTGARDHAWLIAEPAYAKAKGKHIILLVEEGSKYDPTILGRDLEQIRFPTNLIEKCFITILRELRNIRVKGL